MSLIDRVVIVLDPRKAYPEAAAADKALARRDWAACRAVLDAADRAARTTLIQILGERPRIERFLREVLAADPSDSAAAAVLAVHLTHVAWRIRSGYEASLVTHRQFVGFTRRLVQADQVLQVAISYAPADPAVWTARLPVARGLGLGALESARRYAGLAAIDPHHLPGQLHRLVQLCPKWGGDWSQVDAFVNGAVRDLPDGAPNHALLAEAYIERAAGSLGTGSQETTLDLQRAIYRAAERSIFHPEFRRTPGWVRAASSFALAFSLLGDRAQAGRAWEVLGRFASAQPWAYIGDPRPAIRRTGIGRTWRTR